MTIRCEQLDDLLLDGSEFAMATAAKHAESCETCRRTLDDWREISDTARSMHVSWEGDLLWPRIRRALRRDLSPLIRIAAAAVITITIAGTTWYSMRDTSRDLTFDQKILNVAAVEEVERAEEKHLAAIERLEKTAGPDLESPDNELMANYKEKLMLLDDAIAECQTNIEQNRQNAHLRRQLLSMYSEKQRTLQAVMREGDDESNR